MLKCRYEEVFDFEKIIVEFISGTEILYDEPYIDLLRSNDEKIKLPNKCTGFIITYKKGRINGNDSLPTKTRRLAGVFTGGYIGSFDDIKKVLYEIRKTNPEIISEFDTEDSGIEDERCCFLCYKNNRFSFSPLGENDYVVPRDNLEKLLNNIVASCQNVEGIANSVQLYVKELTKGRL
jgi:hypothetical protein